MIRFLQQGQPAKTIPCSFDMSVGEVLEEGNVGGGKVPDGSSATVNGKIASADSRVKAGDTVQVQPRAWNG